MNKKLRIAIVAIVAVCAVALLGWFWLASSGNLPQRDLRRELDLPARGPRKVNAAQQRHTPGPQPRPSETPR